MYECINSLGKGAACSTLDRNSRHWYAEKEKADRVETKFTSHHGSLRFIRLSFGVRNAPSFSQRTMDIIFLSVQWQLAPVYFGDIVIFLETPEEHNGHVRKVLTLPCDVGATLMLKNVDSLPKPSTNWAT